MALFSFFGKKERQADTPGLGSQALPDEIKRSLPVQDNVILQREIEQIKAQRDIARKTAEKIDAIESEIARDILKAPQPEAAGSGHVGNEPVPAAPPSTNPFQPTILTLSSEQRVLLRDEKDN